MLTPTFLREGAIYALEQSGLLLGDAKSLLEKGSPASAIALAAFAREELGRARILRRLADEVESDGRILTEEDIRRECGDHEVKQKAGQLSATQYADLGSGLSKLHRATLENPVGSKAFNDGQQELARVTAIQQKKAPQERHAARMKSLYVEVSDGVWRRPSKGSDADYARRFVEDAIMDYGLVKNGDPESKLNKFLESWADHPVLPEL